MNLAYVKTVYGDRVRINLDDLDKPRKLIRLYNQYGNKLDQHYRKPDQAKSVHRDNLVLPE